MKNPEKNASPASTEKARHALINDYLSQLATALSLVLTDERKALYCRGLADLTETQLRHGFTEALRHLGTFLPSIEQLRQWSEAWRPPEEQRDARDLVKSHLLEAGRKLGVTHEEVQGWLQEGKDAQNEYIAKLEADPEWQTMARRLGGFPGLTAKPSQVPTDPVERKAWATKKAKEYGL